MNFLAHIYLSFNDKEITIGNFIADGIKGKGYKKYDSHPIPKMSSKRLHANYSHYSRVIVDIFYDHFLAKNWSKYSDIPLEVFVDDFYDLLEAEYEILPEGVKRMMPYMIADNWIFNYSKMEGIAKVLNGMNRRTQNKSKMNFAIIDLEEHYESFEKEFTLFFDELIIFSKEKFISLTENKSK